MWFFDFLGDDADQETDQDTKMSALYGKEWRNIPKKNLLDDKYFKEIPFSSTKKTLTCDSVSNIYTVQYIPYWVDLHYKLKI